MWQYQQCHEYKAEQGAEVPPGIGKPVISVKQVLVDLDKMTHRKQERSIIHRGIHGRSRESNAR